LIARTIAQIAKAPRIAGVQAIIMKVIQRRSDPTTGKTVPAIIPEIARSIKSLQSSRRVLRVIAMI